MNADKNDVVSIDGERAFAIDSATAYVGPGGRSQVLLELQAAGFRVPDGNLELELAGIAFTINPATGEDEVVVEACPGNHALVQKHTPAIADVAHKIMRYLGAPQQIEFAIAGCVIYILQARPITRINFSADLGEWTNAIFRDGGSSRVCSPLMWSLYEFLFDRTLKDRLRTLRLMGDDFQAARLFFGRPYWNLGTVKACLSRLPGFVERHFDTDLGVPINYDGPGRGSPLNLLGFLRAIPTVLALRSFIQQQEQAVRTYLDGSFEVIEHRYDRLTHCAPAAKGSADELCANVAAFRQLIEQDYFTVESCHVNTIFALSLVKLEFKAAFPDADFASLVAALPERRSMAARRALREMADRKEKDVTTLLRQFRHHSRLGLDVMAPRWDEDRDFVESLLEAHTDCVDHEPGPNYERARSEGLARLPFWKRRGFQRKVDHLRTFVWLREEMRDLSSRMYYCIRRMALQIARQHNLGDDVFFMSFREIFTLDTGNVQRNRALYESYRHFDAPNEIGARHTYGGAS